MGAKVVISTLWPVVDFPATLVAAALHWYLAEGVPPAEALDNAVGVLRMGWGLKVCRWICGRPST